MKKTTTMGVKEALREQFMTVATQFLRMLSLL